MMNIDEIWQKLKEPGLVAKLRGIGDILQFALPWSAIFFVAFTGEADLAWVWLKATVLTAVIVQVMKNVFNHTRLGARPDGHEMSFPSGHTSGAFSGAWFYLFAWGWEAAAIPLVLAGVTGLSRILAKKHWPRDVVVGATVALLVAAYFFGVL